MENKFISHSKEVVNEFIQNIVFVDDRAYSEEKVAQDFDTSKVLSIFANEGKLCSVYTPSIIGGKDNFSKVLNKADAIVIDWDMRTSPDKTISLEQSVEINNEEDDEEDAPEEDPRGEFACDLIGDVVKGTEGIKVILIYTGDSKLRDISESVRSCIKNAEYDAENLIISNDRIIVAVRAKYNDSTEQFKHTPELKKFIVKYEEIPQCIVDLYLKFTNGLMPNFALKSLSAIRTHTPKILSVFSKNLDMGYLVHKASMEFPEDAKNLLIHIFGDALGNLLMNVLPDTQSWTESWVDTYITDSQKNINGVDITRTRILIKQLLQQNSSQTDNFTSRLAQKLIEAIPGLNKSQKHKLTSPTADLSILFEVDMMDIEESNKQFAILTHHKNIFLPLMSEPNLSLGTIVLDEHDSYFVCIQQRCDSVRINGERRFLFLPLEAEGKNPLLVRNGLKLCPCKDSYAIKTVKFCPKAGETVIKANKDHKGYYFTSVHGERFDWIVELKELHAQRISHLYTTQLSRVGLDESEWLRTRR